MISFQHLAHRNHQIRQLNLCYEAKQLFRARTHHQQHT